MPILSQFAGIVIKMFYNDHTPPHFHSEHGSDEGIYEIETLQLSHGKLPRRVHHQVVKWAGLHQAELRTAWERTRAAQPPDRIDPLH